MVSAGELLDSAINGHCLITEEFVTWPAAMAEPNLYKLAVCDLRRIRSGKASRLRTWVVAEPGTSRLVSFHDGLTVLGLRFVQDGPLASGSPLHRVLEKVVLERFLRTY